MTSIDFSRWTKATGGLLPGQQRVFKDFLETVASGDTTLVYGADVRDGKPCLVNGVQSMMSHTKISPAGAFPSLVSAFDTICRSMANRWPAVVERTGYVSPLMAEFLLRNFGELKPMVEEPVIADVTANGPIYVEPSDAEMAQFCETLTECPPVVENHPLVNDEQLITERLYGD